MKQAVFIDLETSGLDSSVCQVLEVAMVKTEGTNVLIGGALHFYIEWPKVTYETQALDLFGDRRKDRKPHVPIINAYEAECRIYGYLQNAEKRKWTIGGKNIGSFDLPFLKRLCPGFEEWVKHRYIDLGNKYDDPLDEELPNLETCRKRALRCGVPGQVINQPVTHTALEDAVLCAELYCGWQRGLVHPEYWRPPVL